MEFIKLIRYLRNLTNNSSPFVFMIREMDQLFGQTLAQRRAFLLFIIPQSHLLYGGRRVAVELQNRVIPAVAVEILRWPQGHRTANPYVLYLSHIYSTAAVRWP